MYRIEVLHRNDWYIQNHVLVLLRIDGLAPGQSQFLLANET